MAVVYLLGDPVAHSLSPAMQNAAFAALGLPHRYELLRVPAADLPATIARIRTDDVLGANVTIPHKERVDRLLDAVDDAARQVGAVNTLYKRAGQLRGENTDVDGFAGALREKGVDVRNKDVLVLGAGGAARACVHHLLQAGANVAIANRTWERARDLAGGDVGVRPWPVEDLGGLHLVVNATSLGLRGEDALAGIALPPEMTVVDVVATADETPVIARARAAGCVAIDGLLMLLHQGTRAFRLWTGAEAPIAAMRAALPRAA